MELIRIKNINSELSEDDIQNMKMELINLLNGKTFKTVQWEKRQDVVDDVQPQTINAQKQPQSSNNISIKSVGFSGARQDGETTGLTCANYDSDDISEITGLSSIDHDLAKKTHAPFEPMRVLPEETSASATDQSAKSPTITPQECQSTTTPRHLPSRHKQSSQSFDEAMPTNLPVKQCRVCNGEKPQHCFTSSQWRKTVGTGQCIDCVSKCPQWQTSSVTLQVKLCGTCQQNKKYAEFSQSQWRRNVGTGRCRACVEKGLL